MHVASSIESPREPKMAPNDTQLATMISILKFNVTEANKPLESSITDVDDAFEHLLDGRDKKCVTDDKDSKENRKPPPAKHRRLVDEGEIPIIIEVISKRTAAPDTVDPARDTSPPPLLKEQSRRSFWRTKIHDDCRHRHPDLITASSDSDTASSFTPRQSHNEDDRVQLSRHSHSRAFIVSPSPAWLPQDDDGSELIIPNAARLNRIMDSLIMEATSTSHPRRAPRSFERTFALDSRANI